MPTNPDSSGVPGPRKRTLSTKAATNGDPLAENKRQKILDNSQKKTLIPTEKRTTTASSSKSAPAKATTIPAKPTAIATKRQVAPKPAPQRPSVECEDVYDEADHPKSNPPRNPRHIMEAVDGGDNEVAKDPAPEVIAVDDNDEPTNVEAPEESADAELSM